MVLFDIEKVVERIIERGWTVIKREELGVPTQVIDECLNAIWKGQDLVAKSTAKSSSSKLNEWKKIKELFTKNDDGPNVDENKNDDDDAKDGSNGKKNCEMKKDVKENVLILKELYERRSEFDEEWKTDIIRDVFHPTFTRQQFILEMVHLQTHKGIEEFYAALFKKFNHLPSSDIKPLFWTYSERANFTLPKPIGMYVGQRGLPPHYDANPWENEYGQTSKAIDLNKERFLENGKRRWEIDRPFQSFIALNDCVGGHTGGGMGLCDKSHLYFAEMRKLPIHGRNPRWGNVTRITQSPTGKWTEHVDKKLYKKVIELHRNILSNMIYPSYKKGDLVIWLREMVHVGPQGNTSNEYQARCYVNKLPRNIRNDNYIKQQAQSLLEGKATHGNFKEEQLTLSKWSDYAKMVYGLETLKNDRTIIIAQEKNKKIIV